MPTNEQYKQAALRMCELTVASIIYNLNQEKTEVLVGLTVPPKDGYSDNGKPIRHLFRFTVSDELACRISVPIPQYPSKFKGCPTCEHDRGSLDVINCHTMCAKQTKTYTCECTDQFHLDKGIE